jgi:hypothetical protein
MATKAKRKNAHEHFWEIEFPVKNWDNPSWVCRCGKKKKGSIPILDMDKSSEEGTV